MSTTAIVANSKITTNITNDISSTSKSKIKSKSQITNNNKGIFNQNNNNVNKNRKYNLNSSDKKASSSSSSSSSSSTSTSSTLANALAKTQACNCTSTSGYSSQTLSECDYLTCNNNNNNTTKQKQLKSIQQDIYNSNNNNNNNNNQKKATNIDSISFKSTNFSSSSSPSSESSFKSNQFPVTTTSLTSSPNNNNNKLQLLNINSLLINTTNTNPSLNVGNNNKFNKSCIRTSTPTNSNLVSTTLSTIGSSLSTISSFPATLTPTKKTNQQISNFIYDDDHNCLPKTKVETTTNENLNNIRQDKETINKKSKSLFSLFIEFLFNIITCFSFVNSSKKEDKSESNKSKSKQNSKQLNQKHKISTNIDSKKLIIQQQSAKILNQAPCIKNNQTQSSSSSFIYSSVSNNNTSNVNGIKTIQNKFNMNQNFKSSTPIATSSTTTKPSTSNNNNRINQDNQTNQSYPVFNSFLYMDEKETYDNLQSIMDQSSQTSFNKAKYTVNAFTVSVVSSQSEQPNSIRLDNINNYILPQQQQKLPFSSSPYQNYDLNQQEIRQSSFKTIKTSNSSSSLNEEEINPNNNNKNINNHDETNYDNDLEVIANSNALYYSNETSATTSNSNNNTNDFMHTPLSSLGSLASNALSSSVVSNSTSVSTSSSAMISSPAHSFKRVQPAYKRTQTNRLNNLDDIYARNNKNFNLNNDQQCFTNQAQQAQPISLIYSNNFGIKNFPVSSINHQSNFSNNENNYSQLPYVNSNPSTSVCARNSYDMIIMNNLIMNKRNNININNRNNHRNSRQAPVYDDYLCDKEVESYFDNPVYFDCYSNNPNIINKKDELTKANNSILISTPGNNNNNNNKRNYLFINNQNNLNSKVNTSVTNSSTSGIVSTASNISTLSSIKSNKSLIDYSGLIRQIKGESYC